MKKMRKRGKEHTARFTTDNADDKLKVTKLTQFNEGAVGAESKVE